VTTIDAVPPLRGADPGTGTASRRRPPASRTTSRLTTSWALSRRTLLQAGTVLGMGALSIFPAARRAYADGYTIYGACPSYAADQDCSPGCGPSPIYGGACRTSGTYTGYHKNDGVTWKLRPNQCYAGTYDGWKWRYSGACGACACGVERRCHDGYRKTSSGWVKSICRWNTSCGCLTAVSWPTTKRGQTGTNVFTVEYLLTARGYPATIDGIFSSGDETRVKQFQKAKGLTPTGVVDSLTWPLLVISVRYSNSGYAVRGVQRQLIKHGYSLPITGYFGTLTDAAVRDFQRKNGLYIDGIVASSTWRTLTGGAV
jgi:hypothetical protein